MCALHLFPCVLKHGPGSLVFPTVFSRHHLQYLTGKGCLSPLVKWAARSILLITLSLLGQPHPSKHLWSCVCHRLLGLGHDCVDIVLRVLSSLSRKSILDLGKPPPSASLAHVHAPEEGPGAGCPREMTFTVPCVYGKDSLGTFCVSQIEVRHYKTPS